MVRVVRDRISIGVQVIIRPRGGDFLYSDDEFAVMEEDILSAKQCGADGVVFGILRADGTLDRDRCARLRELAYPMNATLHRAFDVTPDAGRAVDEAVGIGFDRILTSGQAPNVWEGIEMVAHLVRYAGGRITIMPGAGLRAETLDRYRDATGAREFHLLIDKPVESTVSFRRDIPMGSGVFPPEYARRITDAARIRIARNLVDAP